MENILFDSQFLDENEISNQKILHSSITKKILIYVKDIKKIDEKEIKPKILAVALIKLKERIVEESKFPIESEEVKLSETDYEFILKTKITAVTKSGVKEKIDYTIFTTSIFTTATGIEKKNYSWSIDVFFIETEKQVETIAFKNITKGTKKEVEKVIFPILKQRFKTDLEVLGLAIKEEDLLLSLVDNDIKDYSQVQTVTVKIEVKNNDDLNKLAYQYDFNIKGEPHNIGANSDIKSKIFSKHYNFNFANITAGKIQEIKTNLAAKVSETIEEVLGFAVKLDEDFIIVTKDLETSDYTSQKQINFDICGKGSKITGDIIGLSVTIIGEPHDINVDSIKNLLKSETIKFKNITQGTKEEVEKHLSSRLIEIIEEKLDFTVKLGEDFTIDVKELAVKDYSVEQVVDITINAKGTKITNNIEQLPVTIIGEPHDINVDSIKNLLKSETIKFKNITQGTKEEVEKHLSSRLIEIIKEKLDFTVKLGEDFKIDVKDLTVKDYSIKQIVDDITINAKGTKITGDIIGLAVTIIGEPHDINIDIIKELLKSETIKFKNITQGTKEEVEKHLSSRLIEIIKEKLEFTVKLGEDFTIDVKDLAVKDYSIKQIVDDITINAKGTKITGDIIGLSVAITGEPHDINVDSIKNLLRSEIIKFKNITQGTKEEVEKHLINRFKEIINDILHFAVTLDTDFTIVNIDALPTNDYSIAHDINFTIDTIGNKIRNQIESVVKVQGRPYNISEIKNQEELCKKIGLESKKIYDRAELKQLILSEVNNRFKKFINNNYQFTVEEEKDYSLEIESTALKNYDLHPKTVQVIINTFGAKITDTLIFNIAIHRAQLSDINIKELLSSLSNNELSIPLPNVIDKDINSKIKWQLQIEIIKNFIELVKKKFEIDVVYNKDFLIDLSLPSVENYDIYGNFKDVVSVPITITSQGDKITGQLTYSNKVNYDWKLYNNDNLLLPPIMVTLPTFFNTSKNQLKTIVYPIVRSKVETMFNQKWGLNTKCNIVEDNIDVSYQYFGTNILTFKIKINNDEKLVEQLVVIQPQPENLNQLTLAPINYQQLSLNNSAKTSKAEIEEHLLALVRIALIKALKKRNNNLVIPEEKILAAENKIYQLTSNAEENDNYQKVKTILVTIKSLQPQWLIGEIIIPINVKAITTNLTGMEFWFNIEDQLLNDDEKSNKLIISNQFKNIMKKHYAIDLIDEDFTVTCTIDNKAVATITIAANEGIQTKICGNFTTKVKTKISASDISNLPLAFDKIEMNKSDEKITKLQVRQLLFPHIRKQLINYMREEKKITITQYEDFLLDINAPESDDYQQAKTIEVIIISTNNKISGDLRLNFKLHTIGDKLLVNSNQ